MSRGQYALKTCLTTQEVLQIEKEEFRKNSVRRTRLEHAKRVDDTLMA